MFKFFHSPSFIAIVVIALMASVSAFASSVVVSGEVSFEEQSSIDKIHVKGVDYSGITMLNCETDLIIALGSAAYKKTVDKCGLKKSIVGVAVNRVVQGDPGRLIYISSPLAENVQFAKKYGERISVLYSDIFDAGNIPKSHRSILVNDKEKAIKSFGFLVKYSDVIVVGRDLEVFSKQFWETAGRLSIKYEIPIVSGDYGAINMGAIGGVYPRFELITKDFLIGIGLGKINPNTINEIIVNPRLEQYFGYGQ